MKLRHLLLLTTLIAPILIHSNVLFAQPLVTGVAPNRGSAGKKIRARVLDDDHPEVVKSLRALVEQEFEVVATVGDGNALIAAAETFAFDVIVTDIAMPGLNGIAAAARILGSNPAARIVFVTVHNQPELVEKGLAIGALGYVLKPRAGDGPGPGDPCGAAGTTSSLANPKG